MAYDETLAERVRKVMGDQRSVSEKKMFGGLSFLLKGNMCCGIVADDLMVRVGPEAYEDALANKHARPMDFTGKPLKGYVYVDKGGTKDARSLRRWVERGVVFVSTMPAKKKKTTKKKPQKKKAQTKRAKR